MKFKGVVFNILFLLYSLVALADPATESLLNELSHTLQQREKYMQEKHNTIKQLQTEFSAKSLSLNEQFNIYNKLHEEYQSYQFDSAFYFAEKMQHVALQLNDPVKVMQAKLKICFSLLSAGMFTETFNSLASISLLQVPDSSKAEYYFLKGRGYHDLAAYNNNSAFSDRYIQMGNAHIDSALALSNKGSLQYYYMRGLKSLKEHNLSSAQKDFEFILNTLKPTYRDYAITASSLAGIYRESGQTGKATEMLANAAIADIKSSTTEAIALMHLAELLFSTGDEVRAYAFIKQALADADFYGARQRKIQVASILPIIEGERLATVEGQKSRLLASFIGMSALALIVVIFAFIIFRQLTQLRLAKKIVSEANNNLQHVNDKLQEMNRMLQNAYDELLEANKIKEEYIGYSFNMYSEYLDKIGALKKTIDKKLMTKRLEEVSAVMKAIDLKKEREALYESFDKIFIKLFPNFVPSFNSFFSTEDKIVLKNDHSLTVELRIFALIRMGIQDHEQIAKILEYSVRTIYNYKTKVKNKSLLSNEEFERRILEIKAF
jgi:hypothetical protein